MSKNTGARNFRKVDVDELDEDKYQEEDIDQGEQGPNEAEVNDYLQSKRNVEALKCVLRNAPIGTKDQAIKDRAAQLVTKVLTSFKQSEVDAAVKGLDSTQIDTLMKYVYIGFESASDGACAILLTWHEKAFAAGGLGSIIRVLTDRKKLN